MSQARYQRHVENYHLQHAAEIADVIARTCATRRSITSLLRAI
jgi:hypothetical protein